MAEYIKQSDLVEQHNQDTTEYSVYVARKRVIPDIRDGLKSVHRRIIYAMYHDLHKTPDATRTKTNRIIGEVMGLYHPHGDAAIKDSMKAMSNWFECKIPYLDPFGNWGDPTGTSAAAGRYTESRLSAYSYDFIIGDLKDTKNAVDWEPNYSEEIYEPVYLPASVPNLLINGVYGIGSGIMTSIPNHNVNEVIDATINLIHNPDAEVVLIPDTCMPTQIINTDWKSICNTGRGQYKVRAIVNIIEYQKRPALQVVSVPDLVFFKSIQENIEKLHESKKLPQIDKILDISEEGKMEIIILLNKDSDPNYVRDFLYASTLLEKSNGVNFEVLVGDVPRLLSYKEYLLYFIEYRKMTKFRLYCNRLKDAKTKFHRMELFIKVLESGKIDSIITKIRKQKGREDRELMEFLIKLLNITDAQARFLINVKISDLTLGNLQKFKQQRDAYYAEMDKCFNVLNDQNKVIEEIISELEECKRRYGKPRMAKLISQEEAKNIPQGQFQIVITNENNIRKYEVGANITGLGKESPISVFTADNNDSVLIFSSMGKVFKLPIAVIPFSLMDIRKLSKNLTSDIVSIILESSLKAFAENKHNFVYTLSNNGYIKRMSCGDFISTPPSGIVFAKLEQGDSIVDVAFCNMKLDIIVYSANKALRMKGGEPPLLMRSTKGNYSMKTKYEMIGMDCVYPNTTGMVAVTKNGYVNYIHITALPTAKRATAGNTVIKLNKTDSIAYISVCNENDILRVFYPGGVSDVKISDLVLGTSVSTGKKLFKEVTKAEVIKNENAE